MGTAFLYGNGGSDLKFYVKQYASETELLADAPKENTIGVVTSTAIPAYSMMSIFRTSTSVSNGYVSFTYVSSNTTASPSMNIVKKNIFAVKLTGCSQYIGGEWLSVNAYLYKGGAWVQFSSECSATINITYPSGSTCTATCGTITLTAPDTGGSWVCVVPKTGTWTVTITDGTNTKSEDVSITTDGQSESLTISYRYYLYNYLDGKTAYDGITGGWNSYATVDSCSCVSNLADMDTPTRCANKIDFSGYKTLCIESMQYDSTSGSSGTSYAIGTQTDTTIFSYGTIKGYFSGSSDAWSTWSIDVSSITVPVYFAFRGYYQKAAIRAMWLE